MPTETLLKLYSFKLISSQIYYSKNILYGFNTFSFETYLYKARNSSFKYTLIICPSEKELAQEQAEDDEIDPFLMDAIEAVIEQGTASTSFIQRRFKVGYARAGRIIDQMEERGIISGYQGSKPREVLMPKERWEELKMGTPPQEEVEE